MPEPESDNRREELATLNLLGEASEEERRELEALLAEDPDLATEQNELQALTQRLEASIPEEDHELPANVLTALEQDRVDVLQEAQAADSRAKTISFPRSRVLLAAIAAALVVGLFLQLLPSSKKEGFIIASHQDAVELAQAYPTMISKGAMDEETQQRHQGLTNHLDQLGQAGQPEAMLEILDALPESAQAIPEFKRFRQMANDLNRQ